MNKKILFLALFHLCLLIAKSFAQPCVDQHVVDDDPINNPNTSWRVSHGTLNFSSNNSPNSTGFSLRMHSLMNQGSGAFVDYTFIQGNTYRVCFWVRNVSGWPGNFWGRLYVYAADGLTVGTSSPNINSKQLIDQSYYGPPQSSFHMSSGATDWEFVTATFTANQTRDYLWIFPLNPQGPPPPGPAQWNLYYAVEVDDIKVEDITVPPSPPITGILGPNTLTGCSSSVLLSLSNASFYPNYKIDWTPAASSGVTTGPTATVKPCSTTTYKAEVYDPSCSGCFRQVFYHTVTVTPWSNPANIIYTPSVPCGGTITLDYTPSGTCPGGVTYNWIEPGGTPHSGKMQNITATALHTGEWTLQVDVGKDCPEEHKFFISVGSCCISNPDFTYLGCNPISFTNNGTGASNLIGVLWNFGDGTSSDQLNPIHSYNTAVAAPYMVCLTLLYKDDRGESCCNRKCEEIDVCPRSCAVTADYTFAPVAGATNTYDFFDASAGNGALCQYEWNFGDGTPPVITPGPTIVQHNMATPGPWWVCLKVTNCTVDANGNPVQCTDIKCMWIYPPPTLVKEPESGNKTQENPPKPSDALPQLVTPTAGNNDKNVLTVYPNPNQGSFVISLYKRDGNYQVLVKDKLGREVYSQKHEFINGSIQISLNDVSTGVYSVEVVNDNERFVQQVSVSR